MRSRRKKADELISKLNSLYPELKSHTDFKAYKYVPRRVTCGVVLVFSFFALVLYVLVFAQFPSDSAVWHRPEVYVVGVILVLLLVWGLRRLARNAENDVLETNWSKGSLAFLQEKLDESNVALARYEAERQATVLLVQNIERLNMVAEEEKIGHVYSDCEKLPFKIRGVVGYNDKIEYDLNYDGYQRVLGMVVCTYYGGGAKNIQSFKKIFHLEEENRA